MSDSVRPHRWQPTRLPRLWDSPGKNTGVGCHFLLQCRKVKSESEVAQSCPTPSDPMDYSPPRSSVHGILQARVLEWGAIAFSLILLPGIKSMPTALEAWNPNCWTTRKFYFHFLSQDSWENKSVHTVKGRKLERVGMGEVVPAWKEEGVCSMHVAPSSLSPLTEMRPLSCRAGSCWGLVITLVFIPHFPWVIQITGNMLSHLYIWHLCKRMKSSFFIWAHWNPKQLRDYRTKPKFKSTSSYFFTFLTMLSPTFS